MELHQSKAQWMPTSVQCKRSSTTPDHLDTGRVPTKVVREHSIRVSRGTKLVTPLRRVVDSLKPQKLITTVRFSQQTRFNLCQTQYSNSILTKHTALVSSSRNSRAPHSPSKAALRLTRTPLTQEWGNRL